MQGSPMQYNIPMKTRNTVVRVRGVLRCAKIQYRTRTRDTRFGNTAGFSVPVLNPKNVKFRFFYLQPMVYRMLKGAFLWSSQCQSVSGTSESGQKSYKKRHNILRCTFCCV